MDIGKSRWDSSNFYCVSDIAQAVIGYEIE